MIYLKITSRDRQLVCQQTCYKFGNVELFVSLLNELLDDTE